MDLVKYIYEFLTKTKVNNSATVLPRGFIWDMFLSKRNVNNVALTLFMQTNINKDSNEEFERFRQDIESKMGKWISTQNLGVIHSSIINGVCGPDLYAIDRLNNNFMAAHKPEPDVEWEDDFEEFNPNNYINRSRVGTQYNINSKNKENLYDHQYKLTKILPDGTLSQTYKKGRDMMPSDYQNWDVWRPQTTYADFDFEKFRSFRDRYGYAGNYIPRNVDRDPASFGLVHRDPYRASLEDTPRAWDNSDYFAAKGL